MFGETLVDPKTLNISPEEFAGWLQDNLTRGNQELELDGVAFTLQSVRHTPLAIVGTTKKGAGSVTIEVVDHKVTMTIIRDGYPTDL